MLCVSVLCRLSACAAFTLGFLVPAVSSVVVGLLILTAFVSFGYLIDAEGALERSEAAREETLIPGSDDAEYRLAKLRADYVGGTIDTIDYLLAVDAVTSNPSDPNPASNAGTPVHPDGCAHVGPGYVCTICAGRTDRAPCIFPANVNRNAAQWAQYARLHAKCGCGECRRILRGAGRCPICGVAGGRKCDSCRPPGDGWHWFSGKGWQRAAGVAAPPCWACAEHHHFEPHEWHCSRAMTMGLPIKLRPGAGPAEPHRKHTHCAEGHRLPTGHAALQVRRPCGCPDYEGAYPSMVITPAEIARMEKDIRMIHKGPATNLDSGTLPY